MYNINCVHCDAKVYVDEGNGLNGCFLYECLDSYGELAPLIWHISVKDLHIHTHCFSFMLSLENTSILGLMHLSKIILLGTRKNQEDTFMISLYLVGLSSYDLTQLEDNIYLYM